MFNEPDIDKFLTETQQKGFDELCNKYGKSNNEIREYRYLNSCYELYIDSLDFYQWQRQQGSTI